MNLKEYNEVKNLSYLEYCDYLQKKYGISQVPYFTKNGSKNPKAKRTKDGLMIHHKMEDHAVLLSKFEIAVNYPYEWQLPENLVYCDYLEHLFLHILICENPSPERDPIQDVGISGIIQFIVPELNDVYSGYQSSQEWRRKCHSLIENNKDVYLELLKRLKLDYKNNPSFQVESLFTSLNATFKTWPLEKNQALFNEIEKL